MSGTNQRQTLRLVRHIPCAVRTKAEAQNSSLAVAPGPIAADRLESLANEFEGYCEQISDRATLNALRTLQRQVDHLQSAVTTHLVQQAAWTQDPPMRRLSLSFDALEIEVLPGDNILAQPAFLETLVHLPGLPAIVCTLQVTGFASNSIVGTFQHISDADLRRLRRYVLVQDAAGNQRQD